jgi:signal transduction histidine kinase
VALQVEGLPAGGGPVVVDGDPRLLRRLARNLLENARRHGAGAEVEGVLRAGADGPSFEVLDRGPGVPEAERERIFEPFHRLAGHGESAGGVGLGLALVRQIARRHGAEVECLPREGGGSRFRVRFGAASGG